MEQCPFIQPGCLTHVAEWLADFRTVEQLLETLLKHESSLVREGALRGIAVRGEIYPSTLVWGRPLLEDAAENDASVTIQEVAQELLEDYATEPNGTMPRTL